MLTVSAYCQCLLSVLAISAYCQLETIQYMPVTSLAGNSTVNNVFKVFKYHMLSNIHGLYRYNIIQIQFELREVARLFSYERPGYEAT